MLPEGLSRAGRLFDILIARRRSIDAQGAMKFDFIRFFQK
jgi:hypothetical protein